MLARELVARQGSIRSRHASGTNPPIRDGVRPVLTIGAHFEAGPELGRERSPTACGAAQPAPGRGVELFSAPLREILARMGTQPVHPDHVGAALGLSSALVASRLGALELAGAVMSLPGGLVARTV